MPILHIVFILLVIGLILYLINKYATFIDGKIKVIINWFVIIAVIIWLFKVTGIWDNIVNFKV